MLFIRWVILIPQELPVIALDGREIGVSIDNGVNPGELDMGGELHCLMVDRAASDNKGEFVLTDPGNGLFQASGQGYGKRRFVVPVSRNDNMLSFG